MKQVCHSARRQFSDLFIDCSLTLRSQTPANLTRTCFTSATLEINRAAYADYSTDNLKRPRQ